MFPFEYAAARGTHGSCASPTITMSSTASSDTLINEEGIIGDGQRDSITFEMLELPRDAFEEFLELCERNQRRHEKLWTGSARLIRSGSSAGAAGSLRKRSNSLRFW
jgi:hypothetical protein